MSDGNYVNESIRKADNKNKAFVIYIYWQHREPNIGTALSYF